MCISALAVATLAAPSGINSGTTWSGEVSYVIAIAYKLTGNESGTS
jgi:hypothetical protein